MRGQVVPEDSVTVVEKDEPFVAHALLGRGGIKAAHTERRAEEARAEREEESAACPMPAESVAATVPAPPPGTTLREVRFAAGRGSKPFGQSSMRERRTLPSFSANTAGRCRHASARCRVYGGATSAGAA